MDIDGLDQGNIFFTPLELPLDGFDSSLNLKLNDDVSSPLIIVDCDLQPVLLTPQSGLDLSNAVLEIVPQESLNVLGVPDEPAEIIHLPAIEEVPDDCSKEEDSEQTIFMCGDCSLVFPSITQIRSHFNSHHKKPGKRKVLNVVSKRKVKAVNRMDYSTQTEDLDKATSASNDQEEIVEEQEEHGCPDLIAERPFKCSNVSCGAIFSSEEMLTKHVEMHTENGFRCPNCPYRSVKWPSLAAHLWRSHAIEHDMYKCSVCKYKSGSRNHLLKHYCAHWEGGGEAACRRCGFLCKNPNDLAKHVAHAHRNRSARNCSTKRTCSECGLELADVRCLRRHIKCVHGAVRPYVCGVCDYSAKTRHTLVLHARQHSYDRPFSCDQCSFTSRDHNTMRRHKLRHSGERPYPCQHCSYSAKQSTKLLNHLARYHPDQGGAHRCPSCLFTTVSAKLMDAHVRTNHPEGRGNKSSSDEQDRNFSSMFPSSLNANEIVRNYPSGIEDDESSSQCYFDSDHVDTGGITIPAEDPKEGNSSKKED